MNSKIYWPALVCLILLAASAAHYDLPEIDFQKVITSFKDIILAISAATTAYSAWRGINKWQEELKGKASLEVLRAVAKATYLLREQLINCRSDKKLSELSRDYIEQSYPLAQLKSEQEFHIFRIRWEKVLDAKSEFDARVLEAESLLLKNSLIKEKCEALNECVYELKDSISQHLDAVSADKMSSRKIKLDIGALKDPSKNELTKKINEAIKEIENEIKKLINNK